MLELSILKADSDFIYRSKERNEDDEKNLVAKLNREQVIFWMWSFAHMIDEMERIGVYHLDL